MPAPAAQAAAAAQRVFCTEGVNFTMPTGAAGHCPSLELCPTSGGGMSCQQGTCRQRIDGRIFNPLGEAWTDAATKKQISKTVRALKHIALKQTATANPLFGVGSKTMAMVFILKKFPPKQKALQISMPNPLFVGQVTEGFFLKTAKGKRVLAVHFGGCSMDEDALMKNAVAVAHTVRRCLDMRLVNEITVELERLALPVWNRKLWDRGKQRASAKTSLDVVSKKSCMPPPVGPAPKKARNN